MKHGNGSYTCSRDNEEVATAHEIISPRKPASVFQYNDGAVLVG